MKTKLLIILLATLAPLVTRAQQFQLLHQFILPPYGPRAELVEGGDGYFYGTTPSGGPNDKGTIFKVNSAGDVTVIHLFAGADGAEPYGKFVPGGNGKFYGTTYSGGAADLGTVFAVDTSGNVTTLHSFSGANGSHPIAGLLQGSDLKFYGTTVYGGPGFDGGPYTGSGTIFKIDSSGQFGTLHFFTGSFLDGADGFDPIAGLIQGSDGNFYGTTQSGGTNSAGTVFKMNGSGNVTTLHNFAGAPSDGAFSTAALRQGTDGNFYGTTQFGGTNDYGTVFRMNQSGSLVTLYSFQGKTGGVMPVDDGAYPHAGLIQASDGYFYGTTQIGGTGDHGIIFKINTSGNLTIVHSFSGEPLEGEIPYAGVIQAQDGNLYGTTPAGGPTGLGTIFKLRLTPSVTFATLHTFSGQGTSPTSPLTQASDGNLYGVTSGGGPTNSGTIFKIDMFGHVTTVHSFMGSDGRFPPGLTQMDATLLAASDGNLYGATWAGGSDDRGTLFRMNLSGNLTTLHSFTGPSPELPTGDPTDGANPAGGLVQGSDGNFYGTTTVGGAATVGTAFKITPAGTFTLLHSFTGYAAGGGLPNPPDGSVPNGSMIRASDGNFYGTTILGGINSVFGTVFKMDALGVETILYTFLGHTDSSLDGSFPEASIIEVGDGQFYGTTTAGGTNDSGTVFKVDSLGNSTLVHSFVNTDGSVPKAELIRASDGNLYGTTENGGPEAEVGAPLQGNGTVYKIDSSGTLTTVHFFSGTDGAHPRGRLIEAADGNLYGTTTSGGSADVGVVFRIATGPVPLSAVSRKAHGSAGNFDINLPLTGTAGIECRTGGASGNHQVVITFASAVTLSSASLSSGTGSVSSTTVSGNQVFVNLTGIANAQTIVITLFGVNDESNTGNVSIPMGVLLGDTTANRAVNSSDISQTKSKSGQAVTSANFRQDVTINGSINSSDISLMKSKSGTGLP